MFKFKQTKKVIEQIHSEFDGASERLLREAKAILNKPITDEKADKLMKLGFSSAAPVEKSQKKKEAAQMSRQVLERVEYYNTYYPDNKFITESIVEEICKKYNLLCGPIDRYIGDVPMKNVLEMERFVLRNEEKEKRSKWDDYNALEIYRFQMRGPSLLTQAYQRHSSPSSDDVKRMQQDVHYVVAPFKICAPEKDFKPYGYSKVGHKLIPDPIVLQPVKGGYLIVTKWGLEGDDPALLNEKKN